jgi:acyl-CoA hydrolase
MCPPDEDGWCNLAAYGVGTLNEVLKDPRITKRIALIDSTGVWPVNGDRETQSFHVSEIDCFVMDDTEFVPVPTSAPEEIDKQMADLISPYIKDGDKVQIGWGGLGEEILANLKGAGKTFDIFSEVTCDVMMDMMKEGIIKEIRCVSPGGNSAEFMQWSASEPNFHYMRQALLLDPCFIGQQDNIVAINSTFQVDLLGQACSEAQGLTPYTAPGGSFGFLYGAIRSKGGRSFLCVRSTHTKGGELVSNVTPWLPEGCVVTTSKVFVMYLVSEYGVADVFMKPLKDRIKAIIKIAHPNFREELKEKILTTPLITEADFEGVDLFEDAK